MRRRKPRPSLPKAPLPTSPPSAPGWVTRQTAPDRITEELEGLDRAPWRRLAAKAALAAEEVGGEALRAFAERHPDRHAQAVAIYARLAGFTEKLEVAPSAGALLAIAALSDAALQAELRRALAEAGHAVREVVDGP